MRRGPNVPKVKPRILMSVACQPTQKYQHVEHKGTTGSASALEAWAEGSQVNHGQAEGQGGMISDSDFCDKQQMLACLLDWSRDNAPSGGVGLGFPHH